MKLVRIYGQGIGRDTIEVAARNGYEQSMKNMDLIYPERPELHSSNFSWETETEGLREDWRRIAIAILQSSTATVKKS